MSYPDKVEVFSEETTVLEKSLVQRVTSLLLAGLGCAIGFFTVMINSPLRALGLITGLGLAFLVIVNVEFGLIALAFITHSNLSTVLIEQFNIPSIAKILAILLIIGILIRYSLRGEFPSGLGPITLLICLFAVSGLISMLNEAHQEESIRALVLLAKDSIVAIIAVIVIRDYAQLRAVSWAMIGSGTILGTVAIFQVLTGTFEQTYWGLSIAPMHHVIGEIDGNRLSGTLGDPNYFAMFQFILLPLALDRLISETKPLIRIVAAYALGAILFTVIFSYSRGGFLGISVMLFVFVCFKRQRAWQIAILLVIGMIILSYTPKANYIERMLTMEYLSPSKKSHPIAEQSFQGRKSEMMVAAMIFIDYPITGVGLGNYERNYQKYAQKLHIDFRKEDREAHCRYLEILAETGLIGLSAFLLLLWVMFYTLRKAMAMAQEAGRQELERSILALIISLSGLLTGYIFLHDAWPRLSWLLTGIAFSVPNLLYGPDSGKDPGNVAESQLTKQ